MSHSVYSVYDVRITTRKFAAKKLDLYITSWHASIHAKWIKDLKVKKMRPLKYYSKPWKN